MFKQRFNWKKEVAPAVSIALPEATENSVPDGVVPFPVGEGVPRSKSVFEMRLAEVIRGPVTVIRAEAMSLLRVTLPVRGAAKRRAAAPFAVEAMIGVPVEAVHVALAPGRGADRIAAVMDARLMAGTDGAVVPEIWAVPQPTAPGWSVWRDGQRALVRCDDGTGFAVRADALVAVWQKAGRPPVVSYGSALPSELGARAAEAPAATGPIFDLRQGPFAETTGRWRRGLAWAAVWIVLGIVGHSVLAWGDVRILANAAARDRNVAQAAVMQALPGLDLSMGAERVLARLQSGPAPPPRSTFLPLFGQVATAAPRMQLRDLTWRAGEGALRMTLTAGDLAELQVIEQALAASGLAVEAGAASVRDDGARVVLEIRQ